MKKILSESRLICYYVLLWAALAGGVIVALLFGKAQSQWRYISLAGFLLSLGCFLIAIKLLRPVQREIKSRYLDASEDEKRVLTGLFYFARGILLWPGLLFLAIALSQEAISPSNLAVVRGKVASFAVVGENNPSLKIRLENNTNQYGINTFLLPDGRLKQMEEELQPGAVVDLWIARADEGVTGNAFVNLYAIQTKGQTYLSVAEYNQARSANQWAGNGLSAAFAGVGLVYLLAGRIHAREEMLTRQKTAP